MFIDINNIWSNDASLSNIVKGLEIDKVNVTLDNISAQTLYQKLETAGYFGQRRVTYDNSSQPPGVYSTNAEIVPNSLIWVDTTDLTTLQISTLAYNDINADCMIVNRNSADITLSFLTSMPIYGINGEDITDTVILPAKGILVFNKIMGGVGPQDFWIQITYVSTNSQPSSGGNVNCIKVWDIADNPGFNNTIPSWDPPTNKIEIPVNLTNYNNSYKAEFEIEIDVSPARTFLLSTPVPINVSDLTDNIASMVGMWQTVGPISIGIGQGTSTATEKNIDFYRANFDVQGDVANIKVNKIYLYQLV